MRALLLLLSSLVIFGCGQSGKVDSLTSDSGFKSGYYVAEGGLAKRSYPLVVIKVETGWLKSYQVSRVHAGGFGPGESTTDLSAKSLGTVIASVGGDPWSYSGMMVQERDKLRLKAIRRFRNSNPEKEEILEEYLLAPVSKEKAMEILRSLTSIGRNPSGAQGIFSARDEEACQGAFELPCAILYGIR